jgi:hypothetical protein
MKTILTILLIFIGGNCFAQQLASEKPMEQIFTQPIKKKLEQPKANTTAAKKLPSEAPLPKQVTTAAAKAPTSQPAVSPEEKKKKLPSNAKKLPAVKRPKKS